MGKTTNQILPEIFFSFFLVCNNLLRLFEGSKILHFENLPQNLDCRMRRINPDMTHKQEPTLVPKQRSRVN